MIPALVIIQALLVALQVFLVAFWPSPVTIACLVFTALLFILTFALARLR
jgi:hypothetical protein